MWCFFFLSLFLVQSTPSADLELSFQTAVLALPPPSPPNFISSLQPNGKSKKKKEKKSYLTTTHPQQLWYYRLYHLHCTQALSSTHNSLIVNLSRPSQFSTSGELGHYEAIAKEVDSVFHTEKDFWKLQSQHELSRIDSAIRESMRRNPLSGFGLGQYSWYVFFFFLDARFLASSFRLFLYLPQPSPLPLPRGLF